MYEIRKERGDFDRFLKRSIIDIGCGDDCLTVPKAEEGSVFGFDKEHGDASTMEGMKDDVWDCVYSSHCLEDIEDVELALKNWVRILKPGGFLYVVVPDFGLYEKYCFPSRFNASHKSTFSMALYSVPRKTHYHMQSHILPIFGRLKVQFYSAELESYGYDFTKGPEIDQTLGNAVAQICFIGRKI